MGILSDFIITEPESVEQYDGKDGVPADCRSTWKTITALQAAQLLAILRGVPYDVTLIGEFSLVYEASKDGPWTQAVPADFVEGLAGQTHESVTKLAAAWTSATAAELPGWRVDDFREVLTDLVRLARLAQSTGKSMYLWNCL